MPRTDFHCMNEVAQHITVRLYHGQVKVKVTCLPNCGVCTCFCECAFRDLAGASRTTTLRTAHLITAQHPFWPTLTPSSLSRTMADRPSISKRESSNDTGVSPPPAKRRHQSATTSMYLHCHRRALVLIFDKARLSQISSLQLPRRNLIGCHGGSSRIVS